jgi:predicted Rossmann-fold nucleotide-binding protein
MPGGFGTLDEFMEILTLIQTQRIRKKCALVLYGSQYWEQVLRFEPLVQFSTIDPKDLQLFHRSDSVDEAFEFLTSWLTRNVLNDDGSAPGGTR